VLDGDVAKRRILKQLHQRLAGASPPGTPVFPDRDDNNFLATVP
jgi:hypothetical protein